MCPVWGAKRLLEVLPTQSVNALRLPQLRKRQGLRGFRFLLFRALSHVGRQTRASSTSPRDHSHSGASTARRRDSGALPIRPRGSVSAASNGFPNVSESREQSGIVFQFGQFREVCLDVAPIQAAHFLPHDDRTDIAEIGVAACEHLHDDQVFGRAETDCGTGEHFYGNGTADDQLFVRKGRQRNVNADAALGPQEQHSPRQGKIARRFNPW